ncbi:MAG TPA: TonB-dependent receptor [Gemmatimonadaceae bacterium]|nr:TonB-dependent receptor [Gemmatimonadaceae bacterium]
MTRPSAALVTLLVASSLPAQEQSPDTARVAPVVITATRTPLSVSALPVAVTVISGDELRLRGVVSVADALQDVTSAYIAQTGSAGAMTSLFLRGGESKYVKVLVDGVPANDPGGAFDFAALTTDNVERIEVVRGPASVLYGADAVTGVVQIITRRGRGPIGADVDLRVGSAPRDAIAGQTSPRSMRTLDGTASTGGGIGASSGSYTVSFGRHESSGLYELNNDYHDDVVSARVALGPMAATELRFAGRFNRRKYDYPTNSGGSPYDSNAYFADDRTTLGLEAERALAGNTRVVLALTSSVSSGGTNDALDAPGGSSFLSDDRIRRRGGELRVQMLPASRLALTFGAQIEHQDQRSTSNGQFGPSSFSSAFSADRHNTGGYAEAIVSAPRDLTLTFGGRTDDNEQFGTFNTGRVGASWRPVPPTRLRVTAGTAFREPTFLENYSTGFVTGNPNLSPERARTADAGIDQDLLMGRARASLTAFAQRFQNMIDYTGETSACGYSYCNVAAARANGVEAEVSSTLTAAVALSVGATFLDTRVLTPGFDTSSGGLYRAGESLIRRPSRTYQAQLSYRGAGPFSGSARLTSVGERADRDFNAFPATTVTLPAYQRLDVGAEYRVLSSPAAATALTLRVENAFNTGYQTVFNYLTARRTISLGARARF